MDVFIAVVLGLLQAIAAVAGVYVTLRPPPAQKHLGYLILFAVLGLGGMGVVALQAYRGAAQQEAYNKLLHGIDTRGERTENKVDKLLLTAPPAQPCPIPPPIRKAKRSQASVERRAISAKDSATLIAKLSLTPAKINIIAQLGDVEGYSFAKKLMRILQRAGWQVTGVDQGMFGTPIEGMLIQVSSPSAPGAGNLQQSLNSIGIQTDGAVQPSLPPKEINLIVGFRKKGE